MTTQKIPTQSASQLLRIQEVTALTTLSKSCINLWVAQERFPRPLALSSTLKVWRAADISAWIEGKFELQEQS
jgi:predicted DNA-binding transcriptional regulator AlpA